MVYIIEDQITPKTMKAVYSHRGKAIVDDTVPVPEVVPNHVLVKTVYSGVSNGTERLMLSHHHETPISLGYSASGIVQEVGEGVQHVKPGDRVACYGAPYVRHAEYLLVPKNLTVPVPDNVSMKEAAFVALGAIGIHAIRQGKLEFGESVAVVGMGILGQIIAQITHAAAYETIVYDLQAERCQLFKELCGGKTAQSKEQLKLLIDEATLNNGVDSVLLCANGSNTGLIDDALDWIRNQGNVVIVGDLSMEFSRDKMFKKEADIKISRAGGAGRYDASYEKEGNDYPIGYVRWTEGRNMAEYIRLLQQKRITVTPLISQEVEIGRIDQVYEQLFSPHNTALGSLITYNS